MCSKSPSGNIEYQKIGPDVGFSQAIAWTFQLVITVTME